MKKIWLHDKHFYKVTYNDPAFEIIIKFIEKIPLVLTVIITKSLTMQVNIFSCFIKNGSEVFPISLFTMS